MLVVGVARKFGKQMWSQDLTVEKCFRCNSDPCSLSEGSCTMFGLDTGGGLGSYRFTDSEKFQEECSLPI